MNELIIIFIPYMCAQLQVNPWPWPISIHRYTTTRVNVKGPVNEGTTSSQGLVRSDLTPSKRFPRFDKPRSSRKKSSYTTSAIRIEGINPFSGAVAREAISLSW